MINLLPSLKNHLLLDTHLQILPIDATDATDTWRMVVNGDFIDNSHTSENMGKAPFGAFPMQWPSIGAKMMGISISDWTINTLFFQLHR